MPRVDFRSPAPFLHRLYAAYLTKNLNGPSPKRHMTQPGNGGYPAMVSSEAKLSGFSPSSKGVSTSTKVSG